nr:MAG TPA: Cytosine specific methyltransferase [Caudoviricetes sp.]
MPFGGWACSYQTNIPNYSKMAIRITHASLFSGIGGFDLAAEWAGWTNSFNCEIDPFCRRILKYHFPNAEQYADIRTTDFTIWRGRIDVLTGGFPCQPFSLAGKRKGTEDERYLWPEMLRVIRTVRPRWIVGENVFGIVNWSEGMVFDEVCSDLEAAGYAVQPYIIPACGVGAPHRRDRCWFVAYCADSGFEAMRERTDCADADRVVTDSYGKRRNEQLAAGVASETEKRACQRDRKTFARTTFESFPSQSPLCCRDDVFPNGLDGITFPRWVRESIKAYGNAIVPQVALQIFETINEYENHANRLGRHRRA